MPQIDHVVINVEESLDEARRQFTRLGFQLTPRGHHSRGTSNHLAIFGTDYLELIGVEPQRAATVTGRWEHPPGLVGLVFKTTDANLLYAGLKTRGVPLDGERPADLSRPVELPDGSVHDARFLTLRLAPRLVPNGRVFFCNHLTPELVWQAPWQVHPNGVTGVARYVYVSADPAAACALLERVHGAEVFESIDGGRRLVAENAQVDYLTPEAVAQRYGRPALAPYDGTDRAIALELWTGSIEGVREVLASSGIEPVTLVDGGLAVEPGEAMGTTLVFRPAFP